MDQPIRKKVTRVGSGAFSIYLPKKWIDAWEPEQQETREVELRAISDSILVTPVISQSHYQAKVPDDPAAIGLRLIGAYIRGYGRVTLASQTDHFGNDAIAQARDLLRHLDERLVATSTAEEIGFDLRSDLPSIQADANDILAILGTRVEEVMRLAGDAVQTYAHDPDKTLHALQLLRDSHDEDVSRLFYQVTRMVATLEIPLESVSNYQLLGLAASDLHRLSEQGLRMAESILREYGFTLKDLEYPRSHLMERRKDPPPRGGVARDIIRGLRDAFGVLRQQIQDLIDGVAKGDVQALAKLAKEARQSKESVQERVFVAVQEHWGTETGVQEAMAAFTASKHATALGQAFEHIASLARHGTILLAAVEA